MSTTRTKPHARVSSARDRGHEPRDRGGPNALVTRRNAVIHAATPIARHRVRRVAPPMPTTTGLRVVRARSTMTTTSSTTLAGADDAGHRVVRPPSNPRPSVHRCAFTQARRASNAKQKPTGPVGDVTHVEPETGVDDDAPLCFGTSALGRRLRPVGRSTEARRTFGRMRETAARDSNAAHDAAFRHAHRHRWWRCAFERRSCRRPVGGDASARQNAARRTTRTSSGSEIGFGL